MNSKRAFLVRAAKAASWGWDKDVLRGIEHLRDIGIVLDRRYPSQCDVMDAIIQADPQGAKALCLLDSQRLFHPDTHKYIRGNITNQLLTYAESVDKDGTITV